MRTKFESLPDRVYMRRAIIPALCERTLEAVLSVGCQEYSVEITSGLAARGVATWTLDIDPAAEQWGAPGRHVVGDAREVDAIFLPDTFDCIIFNGVFGFGINETPEIRQTLVALWRILRAQGLLILGWNTDCIEDPRAWPELGCFFRQPENFALPSRVAFPQFSWSTHVYDFLERLPACGGGYLETPNRTP